MVNRWDLDRPKKGQVWQWNLGRQFTIVKVRSIGISGDWEAEVRYLDGTTDTLRQQLQIDHRIKRIKPRPRPRKVK